MAKRIPRTRRGMNAIWFRRSCRAFQSGIATGAGDGFRTEEKEVTPVGLHNLYRIHRRDRAGHGPLIAAHDLASRCTGGPRCFGIGPEFRDLRS